MQQAVVLTSIVQDTWPSSFCGKIQKKVNLQGSIKSQVLDNSAFKGNVPAVRRDRIHGKHCMLAQTEIAFKSHQGLYGADLRSGLPCPYNPIHYDPKDKTDPRSAEVLL